MKKILFILLVVLLAMSSCRPKGVLSNKKMEDVLVDLHTAEGILQVAGYNYGHASECNIYYAAVLEKNGVTQAEFDSSLVWYTAHPQYFQSVYPKVLARLQKRADEENVRLNIHADDLQQQYTDSMAYVRFYQHLSSCDSRVRAMLDPEKVNYSLQYFGDMQPSVSNRPGGYPHVSQDSVLRSDGHPHIMQDSVRLSGEQPHATQDSIHKTEKETPAASTPSNVTVRHPSVR